jgi:hypothetical protein
MSQVTSVPRVRPSGLVTVAFLKAQLDAGCDHLRMFMPLILDVLPDSSQQSFATTDIQEAVVARHGVAMPQQVVATLLHRAVRENYISRECGRYRRTPTAGHSASSTVSADKSLIEKKQRSLAEALQRHAQQRGLAVDSPDVAIDMLFRFLEAEQVALLLQNAADNNAPPDEGRAEQVVVAEFIQTAVIKNPALADALRGMLDGLVIYNAAFLPDLSAVRRHFKDLRVLFDSNLVRKTLGYEGEAERVLMRETLDVLKGSGIQCLVFDKTVQEIRRILYVYGEKLATPEGCNSLRPGPMARHFLTQRYARSDVREMSALLEEEIKAAGFQIRSIPPHNRDYTKGERTLAQRFASPVTHDELAPRVLHDVDCVAGVLTLRQGYHSATLEDARVVFATVSPLVILNSRLWWLDDERETGIEPVVHIRALTNLAWLKKPSLSKDLKLREMVALCAAALRPEQATWERFLRHLKSLQESDRITSDEMTAIVVSAMSDELLREAEFEQGDPNDIDAATLDEVVERVKLTYKANADERIKSLTGNYEAKLTEVQRRLGEATEGMRRHALAIEGRARAWARYATKGVRWGARLVLIAGALSLITGHPFHGSWWGVVVGLTVAAFVVLELIGILRHVSEWSDLLESALTKRFRNWLGGSVPIGKEPVRDAPTGDIADGHAAASPFVEDERPIGI